MSFLDNRKGRLGAVVVAILAFTLLMLVDVLGTLFFAVTLAYVLLPVKRRLERRGVPNRLAAGLATSVAFVALVALVLPLLLVVYQRRGVFLTYLETLPDTIELSVAEFAYVVDIEAVTPVAQSLLTNAAIAIARTSPLLLTKLFLFTFVVYALLLRPSGVRDAVFGVVPDSHADDVVAFHERVRDTLYGLYIVQAATAVGTFVVALAVFFFLGLDAYFTLAVVAGLLQFLPIIGPSILVVAVSVGEYAGGNTDGAIVVLVVGLVVVAALPDVLLRPRLARRTADLAPSLYFIGFVAGGLSFGAVGVIAGPVVVGVLVEAVEIAAAQESRPTIGTDQGA